MEVESLAGLKTAFELWRNQKRYQHEAVPADLLRRARAVAQRHGPTEVARATKLDRRRLKIEQAARRRTRTATEQVPTFSRIEIVAPAGATRPFAEVETATGLKVRLFGSSAEALELISALCGLGGAR